MEADQISAREAGLQCIYHLHTDLKLCKNTANPTLAGKQAV